MLIYRRSQLTGIDSFREIDVTPDQLDRWMRGGVIQKVMPHLSADDREFIMTGITPEEWEDVFGTGE